MNTSLLRVASHQDSLHERVEKVLTQNQELQRTVQRLERELARQQLDSVLAGVEDIAGASVLATTVQADKAEALRDMVDMLRDRLPEGVLVLGAVIDGHPSFIASAPKALVERGVNAGALIKEVAALTGGSGGGRPEMAQAGGRDAAKLGEALRAAAGIVRKQLGG
jgi:alanyl-tRNA synthetase